MIARIGILGLLMIAGGAHAQPRDAATGGFDPPPKPLWVGQVFDLDFSWRVDWDVFQNLDGPMDWTAEPLVAEPWKEPALSLLPASTGRSRAAIRFQTRAMALKPGSIALAPVKQAMVLKTGTVRMSEYERAATESVPLTGKPAMLDVRPLPASPPDFSGAVGHFTLRSAVEPKSVQAGETISWSLTLSGVGNWPQLNGLPARQVSRDFDVVGKPELKDLPGGTLFERSLQEKVELILRRPGHYQLGPVEMSVFDPRLGRYVHISAPAQTIDVLSGPGGANDPSIDNAAKDIGTDRDPLPKFLAGTGRAIAPISSPIWRGLLALPLLLIAALWLMLAYQRARRLDPERRAREAHARLRATLDRLTESRDSTEDRALVRSWQRDIILRCKLDRAAPIPGSFAAQPFLDGLWAEAEDFLYGRSIVLSEDWLDRAERFWTEQGSPPPFALTTTFRRNNLYPLAATLVLAVILLGFPSVAEAQVRSEAFLYQRVEQDPLDWRSRHNLALNLAMQQRWDEAAGHAGIAWVQHPSSETRRLWTRAALEAGYVTGEDGGIPRSTGWRQAAASITSPAEWQWVILGLVAVMAIGGGILLLVRFGHAYDRIKIVGGVLLGGGAVSALTGLCLLDSYRLAADRDAALVWRTTPLRALPVDTPADAALQLPAGIVGSIDGHFLDWRRIRLADGRSGWLRTSNLIWVWEYPKGDAQ